MQCSVLLLTLAKAGKCEIDYFFLFSHYALTRQFTKMPLIKISVLLVFESINNTHIQAKSRENDHHV
ncbi:hypothetical protein CS022_06335 [Veronia nyctiphanis]|uniref:Uncharacterized protein n=1 Tax=Veronia nyctiphanis TaxID=1278244 RepID=A0A4V1LT44_9GAMM|nr:hypothetical protein CS022_06335 [Veronia nyctiphanis]